MSADEDVDEVLDRVFGEHAFVSENSEAETIGYIVKPGGAWCRVRRAL